MRTQQHKTVNSVGCFLLVATALAGWLPEHAMGTAYTWNSTSGGNWSDVTATGWNTGGTYPNAIGDSATFQQAFANNTTFTIDVADAVVGALALNPSSSIRLYVNRTGGNVLTFDAAGAGPATLSWLRSANLDGNHHDIQAPVVLNDNLVVSGGNCLRISGPITGSGKSITVNNPSTGQLALSGDNSGLTGGITVNRGLVHFFSLNSLGGGGAGNVYLAAGANGLLNYNPGVNLASAIAKIDPTSAGMFGWGLALNEGTFNYNYDFSGVTNLRFGAGHSKIGVTGGSLTFDFANNGNKYAIGGAAYGGGLFDVGVANYLTGSRHLDIVGSQKLTLWRSQDYSGNTVIGESGASLVLAGDGTALNSPAFILNGGGTLTFDNNAAGPGRAGSPVAANLADRIGDTASITLNGGGVLLTGSTSANSSETVGPLIFNLGSSSITVNRGGAFTNTLTAASLQRTSQNGIGTVAGNALGTESFVKFTTAPTSFMVGGGGAAGTNNISIIPWLFNSTRTSFITHDANGLRPLDTSTEYASTLPDGSVTTQNVRLTAGTTMANNTTINSLVFAASGTATLGFTSGKTLTLSSGGMIVNGTTMTVGSSGSTLDLNGQEGVFVSTAGDKCTVNAKITNTGGNGITLSGAGTFGIILSNAANDYTGPTTVVAGKLFLDGNPGEYIPDASELRLHSGTSFVGYSDGRRETVAGLSGSGVVQISNTFKFAIGDPAVTAGTAEGVNLQGGFISPGDDNDNPNRTPGTLILQRGGATAVTTDLRIALGTINLDIASATSFDAIRVDHGSVEITGGTLNLSFLSGFVPDSNGTNTFKIIDVVDGAKTLTGSFPSGSISDGGYTYNGRQYAYTTFVSDNDLYLEMSYQPTGTTIMIR